MTKVSIKDIKPNPNNPRLVKDDKFAKLVQSIKDFPQMLELRPIVVNDDMIVLGGNMRLKACKEAGLKEVHIIKASQLTEEQQREFIIKDNLGYGEWDWNMIANEWDEEDLNKWGLDLPVFGHDINSMSEDELNLDEEFDPIGNSSGLQRVVFIFDGQEEAESYLNNLSVKYEKRNMAWQVNMTTRDML
jgi:ParB-like chromosome segregation protein Spo0J